MLRHRSPRRRLALRPSPNVVAIAGLLALAATPACDSGAETDPISGTADTVAPGGDAEADAGARTPPDASEPADVALDVPEDVGPEDVPALEDVTPPGDAGPDVAPDTGDADADPTDAGVTPDSEADVDSGAEPVDAEDAGQPNECLDYLDCTEGDACNLPSCVQGACVYEPVDCSTGDDDPCTVSTCDAATGCAVAVTPSEACCFGTLIQSFDFEGDLKGLDIENLVSTGTPEIVWTASTVRAKGGEQSLYFGDPEAGNYANGAIVASRVTLPPFVLPAGERAELALHAWADVEEGSLWDVLLLRVAVVDPETGEAGDSVPVWAKSYDNFVMGEWQRIVVDLGAFAGESIALSITFNSIDNTYNDTEGLYLDELWLWTACEPTFDCVDDADCDDGLACTTQACAEGTCEYVADGACCAIDADCDDSDNCTTDTCVDFGCINQPVDDPLCCNLDGDCDDGDDCTDDFCEPGDKYQCKNVNTGAEGCCVSNADCDDGDLCTTNTCLVASGECVDAAVPGCCYDALDCDDGLMSTSDSCVGNQCFNCGDGICSDGEACDTCEEDCGSCMGPTSCVGACGGNAGACYCDSACVSFGDCCPNACSVCGYCGG